MSAKLYIVMVGFEGVTTPLQLVYNVEGSAKSAYQKLLATARGEDIYEIEVEDNFGQTALVNRDNLLYCVLQDLERVHQGQAEVAMFQSRAQAAFQRKAGSDPALRVLTPNAPLVGMPRA